jgi:hypothetical protein
LGVFRFLTGISQGSQMCSADIEKIGLRQYRAIPNAPLFFSSEKTKSTANLELRGIAVAIILSHIA